MTLGTGVFAAGAVIALVIAGMGAYAVVKVRKKVREFSRTVFGTEDFKEGVKKLEREEAETPRSVSGATDMFLPSIMKDFPEFHYEEMRVRAENLLVNYLQCIEHRDPTGLREGSPELREQLTARINMLDLREQREHFQKIRVHRTAIFNYRKQKGRCSVIMQTSVEYFHFIEQDGKVIEGKKEMLKQAKYNIELYYVQDRDRMEHSGAAAGKSLNCPNCGAPVTNLGAKRCAYCGSEVIVYNINIWNFGKVTEV